MEKTKFGQLFFLFGYRLQSLIAELPVLWDCVGKTAKPPSCRDVWLKWQSGISSHKIQGKKERSHLGVLRYLPVQPSGSQKLDQILSLGQQLTSPSNYSDCTTLQNQC